jgi:hypothetical protein
VEGNFTQLKLHHDKHGIRHMTFSARELRDFVSKYPDKTVAIEDDAGNVTGVWHTRPIWDFLFSGSL